MNAEDAEDVDDIYMNAKGAEKKEQQSGRDARTAGSFIKPTPGASVQDKPSRSFRHVLVRVMAVQVVSLALLWWLQAHYGR